MGSISRQPARNVIVLLGLIVLMIATWACGEESAPPTSTANPAPTSAYLPTATYAALTTIEPTALATSPQPGTQVIPTFLPTELSPMDVMATFDASVQNQTFLSNIAYNTPSSMEIDKTIIIQLLINPSLSPSELAPQVTGSGPIVTTTIMITPYTKAQLIAIDKDAFTIVQIPDDPVQMISGTDTTKWTWWVTANKGGSQILVLTIFQLINMNGEESWREVKTYSRTIDVNVTISDWIKSIDWKYYIGGGSIVIVISGLFGLIKYLIDKGKKSNAGQNK